MINSHVIHSFVRFFIIFRISILDALIASLSGETLSISSTISHEKNKEKNKETGNASTNISTITTTNNTTTDGSNINNNEEEGGLQQILEESQVSFSKLSSVSLEEAKPSTSLFSSITDNVKYLIDQLAMTSQVNNREIVINLITNGLDSKRLEWLQKQMQSYSVSL